MYIPFLCIVFLKYSMYIILMNYLLHMLCVFTRYAEQRIEALRQANQLRPRSRFPNTTKSTLSWTNSIYSPSLRNPPSRGHTLYIPHHYEIHPPVDILYIFPITTKSTLSWTNSIYSPSLRNPPSRGQTLFIPQHYEIHPPVDKLYKM